MLSGLFKPIISQAVKEVMDARPCVTGATREDLIEMKKDLKTDIKSVHSDVKDIRERVRKTEITLGQQKTKVAMLALAVSVVISALFKPAAEMAKAALKLFTG